MTTEKELTGYTSIDKPYLRNLPALEYDKNAARKTAFQFILDSAQNYSEHYRSLPAFNYYGRKISNGCFFDFVNTVGNAFLNSGTKPGDVISMFCLNTPETFYTMYGLNDFGVVTEWFNPSAMSADMLREHIQKNNVKTMVIIDVMYPIVKETIKGTDVERIIVTSVQDSFPVQMRALYKLQVFGIIRILQSSFYRRLMKEIEVSSANERVQESVNREAQQDRMNLLQKIASRINTYATKEKILAKASFYRDSNKDKRFIPWKEFLKKYGERSAARRAPYEDDKTKFIVHTGGTTGPAKRIAMTDYAANSSVYSTSLMPFLGFDYEDSFCQLVPPMVAYSLEGMHLARYYQMRTHLIATYDRNEFPGIVSKTKANHYFAVPSFAKTLTENPELAKKDYSFIKSIQHGGEGISAEDDRKIDEITHGKSRHGFGQNEEFGGIIINYDIPGVEKKHGCCGFPLFGTDYIVIDRETGDELPYGTDSDGNYYIGDLLVSGDACMRSYIGESEWVNDSTIVFRDGKRYIVTGDQAYIDGEGRLNFWTREQRIIRTQQGKIFTNIIEDILYKIPEIEECCVVKSPHPSNAAEASCHIVLKAECWNADVNSTIENIVQTVESATAKMYSYYIPGTYEFRKERLPMTPFGKIDFRKLEQENAAQYEDNGSVALKKIRVRNN